MNLGLDEPRGWTRVHGEDYPVFRTEVPRRRGEGLLCGYLRVRWRAHDRIDVIVEEREQEFVDAHWSPKLDGEIDITVHPDEAQDLVDTAADAWLSWARSTHLPDETPG